MAAAMASLNMAAVVPVAVSRSNDMISGNVGSSANFGGMRLCSATTPAPNVSRSSRSLVVRAENEPNLWESVKSAFGVGQKEATKVASQAEKELNKATSEAKTSSGDLGGKAESIKGETQTQAEEAAEKVKAGIEDLQSKVEGAIESAQKN